MDPRRLSFPGAEGHPLAARLDRPEGGEPVGCALVAHCFTCGKDLKAFYHMGKALAAARIATLRFDFTGLGESGGDFSRTDLSTNIGDLVAAARFLADRFEAPRLLIGHSLGGAASLFAAPQIPSVAAVAVIATPSDLRHVAQLLPEARRAEESGVPVPVVLAGRTYSIGPGFHADLRHHDLSEAVSKLGRPLLVLHSPADDIVPVEHGENLFRWARHPKSFLSLDRADHVLSNPADATHAGQFIATWARPRL